MNTRFLSYVVRRDLGEATRRIAEGASMLRTKGEPGTGNIVEAVRHMRKVNAQIRKVVAMSEDELMTEAKNLGAPYELLLQIKKEGKLPVVNFLCWRCCNTSRCDTNDATWSRWCICRLWYLQIRQSS